jgi:hypothetical protein
MMKMALCRTVLPGEENFLMMKVGCNFLSFLVSLF